MAWSWKDMFKSPVDPRRKLIEARRRAERLGEKFKEKVDDMKKERDTAWQEAVAERKAGNRSSAQRALRNVQAIEQTIGSLETRRFTFEQIARKFEMSDLDREIQISIGDLTSEVKLDVAQLEEALLGASDKVTDLNDANKIFDKIARKQMEGISMSAEVAPMSDLESRLEQEVTGIRPGQTTAPTTTAAEPAQEITKGPEELKKLMDEQK